MFNELLNFSFDLYDIDSNITIEMGADCLTVKLNDHRQEILLWLQNDEVYVEVVHDLKEKDAIPLDTLISILNVIDKYKNIQFSH